MFIENANPTIPPRSSGEKRTCVPLQETLRSAGARGGAQNRVSINIRLRWSQNTFLVTA
jgi:hypothetical protein